MYSTQDCTTQADFDKIRGEYIKLSAYDDVLKDAVSMLRGFADAGHGIGQEDLQLVLSNVELASACLSSHADFVRRFLEEDASLRDARADGFSDANRA